MDKVSYENEISYDNYEMTCEISYEFIWELWDDKWEFISQQYEKSNQTNQSYKLKGIEVLMKNMKWQ